jgi:hypothetical protein
MRFVWLLALCSLLAGAEKPNEVRLISIAPSTYTKRFDSLRMGYGIKLLVEQHAAAQKLPLTVTMYDGARRVSDAAAKDAILSGPKVILLGSSTWAQGSSRHAREFFETIGNTSLLGKLMSFWVTSGGAFTGGETVWQDLQRSSMGLGASVMTLGQKLMVLSTDEAMGLRAGEFTAQDGWFLDQFAQLIVIHAADRYGLADLAELTAKMKFDIHYYRGFPRDGLPEASQGRIEGVLAKMNAAMRPSSPERKAMEAQLQ